MSAPFFERTKDGEQQAMIPGTEARQIPTGKLRARKAQTDDLGPLFAAPADQAQTSIEDARELAEHLAIGERLQSLYWVVDDAIKARQP